MDINKTIYHLCSFVCNKSKAAQDKQFCYNWDSHNFLGLTFHNEENYRKWLCSDLHFTLKALAIETSNMGYSQFIHYKFKENTSVPGHHLVSFINCIAVEAPEGTDENIIITEAQKWIQHNYRDNPMKMLGDCMQVDTDWSDVPAPNINSGKYRARVLQEIMDDDDFEYVDATSQVIIKEDGSIIHNNHD